MREGREPTAAELGWFCAGLASGEVSPAQAGAFAMAVCLRGLSEESRVALTLAMRDTGETLRWDLPGPVVDKHSTGGVGDCVSLVLAPALAACGAYVPMISGRGLGHTGGTLDKLEAIPGVVTDMNNAALRDLTAYAGCAIVGAGRGLAPADRVLYAVRDVTATVESVDLITASILSKKLAAGTGALVLDIKTGSGAFLVSVDEARGLARALVSTARGAGTPCRALLSDMSQPLAPALGNALEVTAAMECLTGRAPQQRLFDLSCALGGALLEMVGLAASAAEGTQKIGAAIRDGGAAERFGRMIGAMGGPADFIDRWSDRLPSAPVVADIASPRDGWIAAIDARLLGETVVALGGGRRTEGSVIDPSVGLSAVRGIGARLHKGEPLARIHAASEEEARAAARRIIDAVEIGESAPGPVPLLQEWIA